MMRVAPEDKRMIDSFIRGIKAYRHVQIPTAKPVDKMNIFELIPFGLKMLPMVPHLIVYKHMSTIDYADSFKSPILRDVMRSILDEEYNIHSLFYVLQALSLNNAGVIDEGSRQLALNVAERFKSLGGKLHLGKPVKRIIVEKGVAKGLELLNGTTVSSDYVIAATDAHHLFHDLFEGKIEDKYFKDRFGDTKVNPLNSSCQISLKVKGDMGGYPKMLSIKCDPIDMHGYTATRIPVRNFSFVNNPGQQEVLFTALLHAGQNLYDDLKGMDRKDYSLWKQSLGEKVRGIVRDRYGLKDEEIEVIDVTTPLTYERYTNAYKGSYMAFITTHKSHGLWRKGIVRGVKNFVMAGQWIMSPGGLPIALFAGKHAAYRIAVKENKQFTNLENAHPLGKLILK